MRETMKARIADPVGLHLRAASRIVQVAKKFSCEVRLRHEGVEVNAKSILGLATLAARFQDEVDLICEGEDAVAALAAMHQLIEVDLGTEPEKN